MFQRFTVVMEYQQKPVLPPPFIAFCHFYSLLKYCVRKAKGEPGMSKFSFVPCECETRRSLSPSISRNGTELIWQSLFLSPPACCIHITLITQLSDNIAKISIEFFFYSSLCLLFVLSIVLCFGSCLIESVYRLSSCRIGGAAG